MERLKLDIGWNQDLEIGVVIDDLHIARRRMDGCWGKNQSNSCPEESRSS